MRQIKDICYGDGSILRQYLDVYLPASESFPVLVYFHGGGLESGSKDCDFLQKLTAEGIAVVAANYRLYPSARYPEFIMDAAAATAWVHQNIGAYGRCDKIFVGGSSAGAYLAMMLCMDKRYLTPYNIDADELTGYIFDAGQPTVHFNVLRESGEDSRKIIVDGRAPLYHICGERKYPPIMAICGGNDLQNRYEQTMLFLSTLRHFGHENVRFKLMDATYGHCGYVDEPIFVKTVAEFIREGNMHTFIEMSSLSVANQASTASLT